MYVANWFGSSMLCANVMLSCAVCRILCIVSICGLTLLTASLVVVRRKLATLAMTASTTSTPTMRKTFRRPREFGLWYSISPAYLV